MKLNKDKFFKTEFGSSLQECIIAWDHWLAELNKFNFTATNQPECQRVQKAAQWCQAQWEVYQMAMKQFYGVEYYFTRTDEYFGICNKDKTDWLIEMERKEQDK